MTTPKRKLESGDPDVTALATRRDAEIAAPSQSNALMQIIDRAANDPAFDVAKLQALLDVKKQWEADEARKAFVVAMAAFKASAPTITKNKQVSFATTKGKTEYKHATLDNVCDVVIPALSKHGFTHRWETSQEGAIAVTCIITHSLGHSERTTLRAASDDSGGKNAIQAIGSTVTYLQRYTLLEAVGLAVRGTDNDGAGAPLPPVSDDLVREVEAKFDEVGLTDADLPRFLQYLDIESLPQMTAPLHAKAMLYLNQLARAGSRKK